MSRDPRLPGFRLHGGTAVAIGVALSVLFWPAFILIRLCHRLSQRGFSKIQLNYERELLGFCACAAVVLLMVTVLSEWIIRRRQRLNGHNGVRPLSFWRIHLLTAVVILLIGGIFVGLNAMPSVDHIWPGSETLESVSIEDAMDTVREFGYSDCDRFRLYGWPFTFWIRENRVHAKDWHWLNDADYRSEWNFNECGEWNLFCNVVVFALIAGSVAFALEYMVRTPLISRTKLTSILPSLIIAGFVIWLSCHHDLISIKQAARNDYPYGYAVGWPMRVTSYAQRTSDYFYNQEDNTSLLAICVDHVVVLALSLSAAVFFHTIFRRLHGHRSVRAIQRNRLFTPET